MREKGNSRGFPRAMKLFRGIEEEGETKRRTLNFEPRSEGDL